MRSTLQLGKQGVAARLKGCELLLRQLAHVGILHQLFRRRDRLGHFLVLPEVLDERLHFGQLLRVRTELDRVGLNGRVGHLRHQLVVTRFCCRQLIEHVKTCDRPRCERTRR